MNRSMMKISIFMILLITTVTVATPTYWRTIKPGLQYTRINLLSGFHTGYLHAFKIDLSKFRLKLAIAEDDRNKIATVEDLTLAHQGLLGINGGFFSQELKPLGLRITDSQMRSPLKNTSWWGVFYLLDNKPYIVPQKQYQKNNQVQFAIQSGPRLVINGRVPISLKPGVDSRSAIGITRDNQIILVVTDNLNLTTTQLARMMAARDIEGGLGCQFALNLDGGSSTQLFAKLDNFSLDVSGFSAAVTDAILVLDKN